MTHDLATWKDRIRVSLTGWRERMRGTGIDSVYGFLCGAALWPIAAAVRTGDPAQLLALGGLLQGVGGGLITNRIQAWKDEADAARSLGADARKDADLRAVLDTLLEKLEVAPAASAALPERDRQWLRETLTTEMQALAGSVAGSGNVTAQRIIDSIVVTGDHAQVNVHHHHAPAVDPKVETRAHALRAAYLSYVLETSRPLALGTIDTAASGSGSGTCLDLAAVYTALMTTSTDQPTMEDGRHARSQPGEGPPRHRPAVEMLDLHRRLVLLGEPGGGKTTFIAFVALCMAGELLGRADANLQRLTAALPDDDGDATDEPQPWRRAALIPIRVVLRDLCARGLPAVGQPARASHLWDFIVAELVAAAHGEFAGALADELRDTGGLLLLDGLDEVPEAEERRDQVKAAILEFAQGHPQCRFLVTCRTYAYQDRAWRLPEFEAATLAAFTPGQVVRFIRSWYDHVAPRSGLGPDDARGRAALLEHDVLGSPSLLDLARRPLLLTLMASLHLRRGGSLPGRRAELYAAAVQLLLDQWEGAKVKQRPDRSFEVVQASLAEWLKADQVSIRGLLESIAHEVHAGQSGLVGTADIPEARLVQGLSQLAPDRDQRPLQLVDYLSHRAGLLAARGGKVYTFPHRTFQEYLAACHLTDHDYPEALAALVHADPERWREVALLAAGKASAGASFAGWALVDALCAEPPGVSPEANAARAALIAGQALVETADVERVSASQRPKLERVGTWLVDTLERGELPALERAAAGDVLGKLGDARFDPERLWLPREGILGFLDVPAGRFTMGSKAKDDGAFEEEEPEHHVTLPRYMVGRYPVTVAQFRAYVDAARPELDGEEWREGLPNHPVNSVSWNEALGYCAWLTTQLREGEWTPPELRRLLAPEGRGARWSITLPSEAEWEKAARGTADVRVYPWEGAADPNRANYNDTGLGRTSAVGCFPGGRSPVGCDDMAGNVWEWTRSLWGKDWQRPEQAYPYDPLDPRREDLAAGDDVRRVLRGGSFAYVDRLVRCACRWILPWLRHGYVGFRLVASPSPHL